MKKIDMILNHLQTQKKITSWEAIQNYGVTRLAAVIHQLKMYGHDISTEIAYGDKGVKWSIYHYRGFNFNE